MIDDNEFAGFYSPPRHENCRCVWEPPATLASIVRRFVIRAVLVFAAIAVLWLGVRSVFAADRSARPTAVRASQFILVDDTGRMRGMFGMMNGQPSLTLLAGDPKRGVRIQTTSDGGKIQVFGDTEKWEIER